MTFNIGNRCCSELLGLDFCFEKLKLVQFLSLDFCFEKLKLVQFLCLDFCFEKLKLVQFQVASVDPGLQVNGNGHKVCS